MSRCKEFSCAGELEFYDGGEPNYEGYWYCTHCAFVEYEEQPLENAVAVDSIHPLVKTQRSSLKYG